MSSIIELTIEQRLVIVASRLTFKEKEIDEMGLLLKQNINWYDVFKYSLKNRVLLLIWYNINKYSFKITLPKDLEQIIEMFYLGTKQKNQFNLNELKRISIALDSNQIKFGCLKGSYLIPNIYKDYGIRVMNDIDIMVKHTDSPKIPKLMESLGYVQGDLDRKNKTIIPISREKQILWKTKMSNLFPFFKISDSDYKFFTKIDFTCGLENEINYEPVDEMIERVRENHDIQFSNLKPSDFFIHLCCHLYKEASNAIHAIIYKDINLYKFVDIREYIQQMMTRDDLKDAISFTKKYNLEKPLYYALYYLREIYNDGYEEPLLEVLDIDSESFLNMYGAINYGQDVKWKKSFWERLFSSDNSDEIKVMPKYFDI